MLGHRTLNVLFLLIATCATSTLAQSSLSANLDAIIANATAAHDTKAANQDNEFEVGIEHLEAFRSQRREMRERDGRDAF